MSDPQPPQDNSDEELKQVLAAAFGDDALNLLDDDDQDEIELSQEMISGMIPELTDLNPSMHQDSPKLRWMKELTRSIYADRQVASQSDEPTADQDATENSKFLVFGIGQQWFGLPLPTVSEIARLPIVTSLPFTPNYLRGVTNIRGEILSVTDFRNLIQDSSRRLLTGEKIVILNSPIRGTTTALVVDRVVGIRDLESSSIQELHQASPALEAIATGTAIFEQQTTILIDSEQLLDQASQFQPAM